MGREDRSVGGPAAVTGRIPPHRRLFVAAGVVAGVALLGGILGFGLNRDPRAIRSPLVDRPAPAFDLAPLDGDDRIRLADYRGQVVVVNFWASWCAPCRQEHPDLQLAWQRFRDRGVVIVGIVYQDTPSSARAYVRELGGGWPLALDPDGRTAIRYGVHGIPETYFIGPEGRVAYRHVGAVSYDVLAEHITRLLGTA